MTEEEQYQRGLEKLGFTEPEDLHARDLRKDPAFAWRVAEALDIDVLHDVVIKARAGVARVDALYAAVCALGGTKVLGKCEGHLVSPCCNLGRYEYEGRILCRMHFRLATNTWGYRGSGQTKKEHGEP